MLRIHFKNCSYLGKATRILVKEVCKSVLWFCETSYPLEDLEQDAYELLLQYREEFRNKKVRNPEKCLKTFLFRKLLDRIRKHERYWKAQIISLEEFFEDVKEKRDPEYFNERKDTIFRLLYSVDDLTRRVIYLRIFSQARFKVISRCLGTHIVLCKKSLYGVRRIAK